MKENDPIRELRRWKKGESLKARKLNEPVDAINRISGGVRPPRQRMGGSRPVNPESLSKVQQFKVVSVQGDYLVCNPYDSLAAATNQTVLVAKPYLLRQTPFDGSSRDGVTYTYTDGTQRSADDGSETETQLITPSYVSGDIIYAIRNISGKTDTYDTLSLIIEWLDLNVDGRSWAEQV